MKQNTTKRQEPAMPLGQVLYLKDYIPAKQASRHKLWERTPGVPEWLELVSIWMENLTGIAMTMLSVGWMWYCMACV